MLSQTISPTTSTATSQAEISLQNDECLLVTGPLDFVSVPVLLSNVKKLLKQSLNHAHTQEYIEIDLAKVTHSNSAGIAFLLELNRLCHVANRRLRIKNMSEQMQIIARVHGVDEPLTAMLD